MNIKEALETIEIEQDRLNRRRIVLFKLAELLPNYTGRISTVGYHIDFDYPKTREQVTELMLGLGAGKWEKSANLSGTTIDYETQAFDEFIKVRIWSAPPPESCRIIETEVEVPAQPARMEKRRKVVCTEAHPVVNPEPETEPSAIAP